MYEIIEQEFFLSVLGSFPSFDAKQRMDIPRGPTFLRSLGNSPIRVNPLCFLLYRSGLNSGKKDTSFQNEFLSGLKPLWIWSLLAAAWVLRLWKIGDQVTWPSGDEGPDGLSGHRLESSLGRADFLHGRTGTPRPSFGLPACSFSSAIILH